jgi:hypothetical protein
LPVYVRVTTHHPILSSWVICGTFSGKCGPCDATSMVNGNSDCYTLLLLTEEIIVTDNMHTSVREMVGSDIHDEIGDIVWCLHGFPEYLQATVGASS